ncbi:MAG: DUF4363 family protein [Oscillospiraceae bacterium]|jgi:hypothetical protein|nr:DUF4363 family protein [Oscillospiraceae bacterium]MCI9288258.1 DUF4363 family protein [Oscillospiraceae bacterium]MCI9550543.1 DUF4363 family protein [Oscillospiraceae bacterium]
MRRLYLSIALILLLAGLSGLHVWHLHGFTSQLTGLLTQAQQHARQEDWAGAALLTRQAKERWTGHEGYLHTTLRHTDIDAVLISLDEALAFLEGEEKQSAEYAAVNARLLTQLELLVEAELPTLTNLL